MNEGVDAFAKSYLEEGLARGCSPEDLFRSVQNWLKQPHGRFLVVDPDRELARILAAEISEALGRTVPFAGYEESNALCRRSCVRSHHRTLREDGSRGTPNAFQAYDSA